MILRCLFSLLQTLALCSVGFEALKPINIGGMFNQFDSKRQPSKYGSQRLAAFLMAVNEINNKTDNIFDEILPDYYFNISVTEAHDFIGAVHAAEKLGSSKPSPLAIVGGIDNIETIAALHMLETVDSLVISCTATSSELSRGRDFPYKIRTVASESYAGRVLQQAIFERFDYSRLVIFSTADYFSSQSHIAFTSESHRKFEILGDYLLEPGYNDYSLEVQKAASTGALVFVLLTDGNTTAELLYEGTNMGLFGEGRIVFCHDLSINAETVALIQRKITDKKSVHDYLQGVISFIPRPLYPVVASQKGQEFLQRWSNQENTISASSCSSKNDSYGSPLFAKYSKCAGLNFSSFHSILNNMINFEPEGIDFYIGTIDDLFCWLL